jgi:hypothetical protein
MEEIRKMGVAGHSVSGSNRSNFDRGWSDMTGSGFGLLFE